MLTYSLLPVFAGAPHTVPLVTLLAARQGLIGRRLYQRLHASGMRAAPTCHSLEAMEGRRPPIAALTLGVAAWCVAGCGGQAAVSAGSDASVASDIGQGGDAGSIGTVEGTDFVVRAASAVIWEGANYHDLGIGLTTESGTECGPAHAGAWALALYVLGEPAPLGPGTYPIGPSDGGPLLVDACLHGCGFPPLSDADPLGCAVTTGDGVITLTSLSPRVTGSFDVTVDGVHLSGPFDATLCGADAGVAGVGMLDGCR